MATIQQFEDILAWQRARTFAQWVNEIVSTTELAKDYKLKQQIEGSSGSIMDNIAEGFERGGRKEFINFLSFAKGSCGEARSQLYRLLDNGYVTQEDFELKKNELIEIGRMISGLMRYLKSSEHKGWKFEEEEGIYLSSEADGVD